MTLLWLYIISNASSQLPQMTQPVNSNAATCHLKCPNLSSQMPQPIISNAPTYHLERPQPVISNAPACHLERM
jgi:hypothetical protein